MKKILVIDDEELLIRTYSRLFEKNNFEVYTVKNGQHAEDIISEENFDLIVCDIRMPGKNGVETIKEIKKIVQSKNGIMPPVIFITGFADEIIEKEAKTLKPIAYLYKPFDYQELLKVVQTVL